MHRSPSKGSTKSSSTSSATSTFTPTLWIAFLEDDADLASRYGGSLSGEHGDGRGRGELLERMYGPQIITAFREFKAIFDPSNAMNPGKIVDPNPLDEQLRLGVDYRHVAGK